MPTTISRCIKHALLLALGYAPTLLLAQPESPADQAYVMDRVMAIVDNDIVLKSDIDTQYEYALKSGEKDDGTLRCSIFESLLSSKLLLAKAKLDSLKLSEDQVESELSRRISSMVQQVGSVQEVENLYKKSLVEIKVDLRPNIREQLLVDQQKQKIYEDIKASPKEVKEFFYKIPKDSLPFLPAEVEISHIMLIPKASEKSKQEMKDRLEEIRKQIVLGQMSFEQMARHYGMDGTAEKDGSLGEFGRGQMVAEFEDVVYNLNEGQLSPVFESPFGFHIARVEKRIGDRVQASHILLIPKVLDSDDSLTLKRLLLIKSQIARDSISFEKAAAEFSEDKRTKDNGGIITSPSGDLHIPLDQLESDLYFKIDRMKVGEVSEPLPYIRPGERSKAYHIVRLRSRVAPHVANLKDDFQKFQDASVRAKQAETLEKWFKKARQQVFVEIKENDCSQALQNWN